MAGPTLSSKYLVCFVNAGNGRSTFVLKLFCAFVRCNGRQVEKPILCQKVLQRKCLNFRSTNCTTLIFIIILLAFFTRYIFKPTFVQLATGKHVQWKVLPNFKQSRLLGHSLLDQFHFYRTILGLLLRCILFIFGTKKF